jgi:hypothetical protein
MEFYYFGGYFDDGFISKLEESGFSGVMFTYDSTQGDMFTQIARDIKQTEKIKYLVAIRPYTISPQYLCMINRSINKIMPGRLQINFISGYIKDHESSFGGIIGETNDSSSNIDKSKYIINYLDVLNTMPGNQNDYLKLDFYVSTTNQYVLPAAQKYNNKIILPYKYYRLGFATENFESEISGNEIDLKDTKVMLAITPVFRKTEEDLKLLDGYVVRPVWRKGEKVLRMGGNHDPVSDIAYFTYEQFDNFVDELEKNGINQLLMNAWPPEETDVVIEAIKEYTKRKELESVKIN